MRPYEILESPSELRIRVHAPSYEEIFRRALIAMFEIIEPAFDPGAHEVSHAISIKSADRHVLLVDFLSRALYLSDINDEAYFEVHFTRLSDCDLEAIIIGRKVKSFDVEIKAVTYHGVNILEDHSHNLSCEITFDI